MKPNQLTTHMQDHGQITEDGHTGFVYPSPMDSREKWGLITSHLSNNIMKSWLLSGDLKPTSDIPWYWFDISDPYDGLS